MEILQKGPQLLHIYKTFVLASECVARARIKCEQ